MKMPTPLVKQPFAPIVEAALLTTLNYAQGLGPPMHWDLLSEPPSETLPQTSFMTNNLDYVSPVNNLDTLVEIAQ